MKSYHFSSALMAGGWVSDVRIVVVQGRISAIETGVPAAPGDERHACVLPGMPNLHSHAFQRGMAGLTERRGPLSDSFWTWREVMYDFVDRLTPEDLLAIAAMAYVEMLETGFVRVGEFHYLHHAAGGVAYAEPARMSAAIVEAASETGIGLTLLPVFYQYAGFGGAAPSARQRRFIHDLEGFAALLDAVRGAAAALPDAVVGVAPHSLRAVGPAALAPLADMAGAAPLHIHIAEQVQEVDDCLAWSGRRPVEWLLDAVDLDERWCLVHATHMTKHETQALARSGAAAGICPVTEANLGDGLFPAEGFLAAGGRLGIGSDSNVLIDASEELRVFEYGQRLVRRERNLLAGRAGRSTGEAAYRLALAGGGQALGAHAGLSPGAPFDAVSLDTGHPSLAARPPDRLLDGFVFAAGRNAVDCVWRHGHKQVSRGRHRARDRVSARYKAALATLLS